MPVTTVALVGSMNAFFYPDKEQMKEELEWMCNLVFRETKVNIEENLGFRFFCVFSKDSMKVILKRVITPVTHL